MPIEVGFWRIDHDLKRLAPIGMAQESRLEDLLTTDISIASTDWMIIGRQVVTYSNARIDLLAIDINGNLVVLELKRDQTPREIVAQLLDYGSWVRKLEDTDIVELFNHYQTTYFPDKQQMTFDDAFRAHFGTSTIPEELNSDHELVAVATGLDESTERIINYLAEYYSVRINTLFFHVFRDGDSEYLSRVWLIDPEKVSEGRSGVETAGWDNNEVYVNFGHELGVRSWLDAKRYGFVCAGRGLKYSSRLDRLTSGDRIWVRIPQTGFVGVGMVTGTKQRVDSLKVYSEGKDETTLLSEVELNDPAILERAEDPELAEYAVPVQWIKSLDIDQAIDEKGLFGNQNIVCKPTSAVWKHTIERLSQLFEVKLD